MPGETQPAELREAPTLPSRSDRRFNESGGPDGYVIKDFYGDPLPRLWQDGIDAVSYALADICLPAMASH